MPSPLHIRSTLQPTELGQNHREFVVDVTDCVEHCDAQYGCINVVCSQVHLILDIERPRGSFIRTNNKLYLSCERSTGLPPIERDTLNQAG